MLPNPLHPAVVHFPIVFGVLLPVVAIVVLVAVRRGARARSAWMWAVLFAAGLFGSAWLAVETGEEQEEVVEEVVAEAPIHRHEEAAETFFRLSGLALLLFGAGLVGGRAGQYARYAATAAALLLLGAGYRVGASGGELVYEHGAAAAYAGPADGGPTAGSRNPLAAAEHEERDDEREDRRR